MNANKQYHIFLKSLAGVFTIIVLGSFLLIRGTKEKNEFQQLSGIITYIGKTYEELPNRNHGKYRFLSIDKYNKVFELFVGKDAGDFKPELEKIDDLKIGDEVVVYFDENSDETDIRLNRLMQYIDKDGQAYFIYGSLNKFFGCFIIGIGLLLGVWIIYLKKIGKIY